MERNPWIQEQELTAWEGLEQVALTPVGQQGEGQSLGPLPAPSPCLVSVVIDRSLHKLK